jgi:ubiquitin-protein ligase
VRDSLDKILASIGGPPGTPYEGGVFWITVQFAEGKPPALRFHTRIYHPNIDSGGDLCADYHVWWRDTCQLNCAQGLPKHSVMSWFSSHSTNHYTLGALLVAICALLASPNIHDPLVPEIAEKYLTDFDGYCAAAKLYMEMYAQSGRPVDDQLHFASIDADNNYSSPFYHVPEFKPKLVSGSIMSKKQHTESLVARYNFDGLENGSGDSHRSIPSETPLHLAARIGNESYFKLLLDSGDYDVNLKNTAYGQIPLSRAAEKGHEALIKLLLDTGTVEVDSKDNNGQTPLSHAARMGHETVVKLLLATGKADVNSKDTNGQTPLSGAAKMGHVNVVKLLLDTWNSR